LLLIKIIQQQQHHVLQTKNRCSISKTVEEEVLYTTEHEEGPVTVPIDVPFLNFKRNDLEKVMTKSSPSKCTNTNKNTDSQTICRSGPNNNYHEDVHLLKGSLYSRITNGYMENTIGSEKNEDLICKSQLLSDEVMTGEEDYIMNINGYMESTIESEKNDDLLLHRKLSFDNVADEMMTGEKDFELLSESINYVKNQSESYDIEMRTLKEVNIIIDKENNFDDCYETQKSEDLQNGRMSCNAENDLEIDNSMLESQSDIVSFPSQKSIEQYMSHEEGRRDQWREVNDDETATFTIGVQENRDGLYHEMQYYLGRNEKLI
jgi:hypothetical protein